MSTLEGTSFTQRSFRTHTTFSSIVIEATQFHYKKTLIYKQILKSFIGGKNCHNVTILPVHSSEKNKLKKKTYWQNILPRIWKTEFISTLVGGNFRQKLNNQ
jgi:hypothetical protein